MNDWFWRRVGTMRVTDGGAEAFPAANASVRSLLRDALTWRLTDRALLIAVAYPVLALSLPWLLGSDAVLGAGVVVLPAVAFWPARAVIVGQIAILTAALVGRNLAAASPRPFWRGAADWLVWIAVAVSFAGVFAVVGAGVFAVAVAVSFAVAGVFAGAVAFTVAFAVAVTVAFAGVFAGAVAFTVAFAVAVTVAFAVAVTVAFAVAVDHLWTRDRQGLALGGLAVGWASGLLAAVLLLDMGVLSTDRKAFFVFLAVLPLINGLFDALSYAITLAFMRRGLATRWAFGWGLADLGAGLVLFLALGATMVAVIAVLNAIGTAPLYDLTALFAGLRDSPGDYWWLFLILFSTLAPTGLHLLVAVLAVQALVPLGIRQWVAGWVAYAPDSPVTAVGAFLAQATIWWLPLIALPALGWVGWHFIGTAATTAGGVYLDLLEALALWIGAI